MGLTNFAVTRSAASLPKKNCQLLSWNCGFCSWKKKHTQSHNLGKIIWPKPNHDGISITINNLSVMRMSIGDAVFSFHFLSSSIPHECTQGRWASPPTNLLCLLNHLPTIRRDTRRDSQTREFPNRRTREPIHRIGTDLYKTNWVGLVPSKMWPKKNTLRASCRPSNTAFLNGSVSFFRSALARLRADIKSSRMVGSRPFRFLVVANRSVEVGK